jgi:VIT1/CCC1 family predicted Fe2+/Mn2+ transporter
VLSLIASTIVFFVASYFIKRYLDGIDIPKSMTRSLVIFCLALALSYGVAVLVDFFVS